MHRGVARPARRLAGDPAQSRSAARLHLALRLALEGRLRQRLGYRPQCLHHDDGILIRLTDTDEPILDLLDGLTPENVEGLILDELADSALFALRFRQNAARALLLPRGQAGQAGAAVAAAAARPRPAAGGPAASRLSRRRRDVPRVPARPSRRAAAAATARRHSRGQGRGGRRAGPRRRRRSRRGCCSRSRRRIMYQLRPRRSRTPSGRRSSIASCSINWSPRTVRRTCSTRGRSIRSSAGCAALGQPPRSAAEMAEWLRRLGDLTRERTGRADGRLPGTTRSGGASFVLRCRHSGAARCPLRWVAAEEAESYRQAFGLEDGAAARAEQRQEAGAAILARFLDTHALVGLADVLRAAIPSSRIGATPTGGLGEVRPDRGGVRSTRRDGAVVRPRQPGAGAARQSGILRREVVTCSPPQFADFLLRWQGVHPETRRGESEALADVLARLQRLPLDAELWERSVLPRGVPGYQPALAGRMGRGRDGPVDLSGDTSRGGEVGRVAFFSREMLGQLSSPAAPDAPTLEADDDRVLDHLRRRGALFLTDLAADSACHPASVAALGVLMRRVW